MGRKLVGPDNLGVNSKRQIVQISATMSAGDAEAAPMLYALCDDGTVWRFVYSWSGAAPDEWRKMPDIPQGKPK